MNIEEVNKLIKAGESQTVEFKQSFNRAVIETLVAFANTQGGQVLIGVKNNGEVVGVDINEESIHNWVNEIKTKTEPVILPTITQVNLGGKKVVVVRVVEFPIKPLSFQGRYFVRRNNSNHCPSVDEILDLRMISKNQSFDSFLTDSTLLTLDKDAISLFFDKISKKGRFNPTDRGQNDLEKLGLIENGVATRAAELLFGNHNTSIHIGRFKTAATIIDDLLIKEPLIFALDETMNFIKRNIRIEYGFTGELSREEKWQFPLQALRELLLNAIIHKDYRNSTDVIIKIFDNSILFSNPGTFLKGLSVEDLKTDTYQPVHRNKLLAEAFYLAGDVEKYGTGFIRIRDWLTDYPELEYNIELLPDFVRVKLNDKVPDKVPDRVPDKVPDKLSQNQKKIIELILLNNRISMQRMADKIGISKRKILVNINKLRDNHMLRRVGDNKTGHWEVISSQDERN